ncbi:MAG: transcription antitermination factor NusB [Planctomycetota bacterium]
MDKRTRARELAMQVLYQLDVQGDGLLQQDIDRFLVENSPDEHVRKLADSWIRQTWENLRLCDELISSAMIKWDLSRLSRVDKSILRLAVFQMRFCCDIPHKVVINEAIEIAKKFSSQQAPGFVNGVLDAIQKKLPQNSSAENALP